MVPLVLVVTNFKHRLTDLHLLKLIMIGPTFRDIFKFSGVNPGVNIAIPFNFLVPFSYACITIMKKIYLQKNMLSLLYKMRGFIGTILCLVMFKLHQAKS